MSEHLSAPEDDGRLHEGDIIRGARVPLLVGTQQRDGERVPELLLEPVPWLIVCTQDCDLEMDYFARNSLPAAGGERAVADDKRLRGMIVAPGWGADEVVAGTYVPGATPMSKDRKNAIVRQESPRFYYVAAAEVIDSAAVVFDLKLMSTVPPAYAEQEWLGERAACLSQPWREQMLQHLFNYLGRVAVPELD